MTEETSSDSVPTQQEEEQLEQHKTEVKEKAHGLWKSLLAFLKNVLSLKDGIDREGTMEGIRQDVEFKGHAAWILICSILIASIGLNVNSIPVIIGAMLISPLMGPILGIGLGAGINDWKLLTKSARNLAIAVGISLVISTLYFALSPVKEASLELVDRTNATILALLVAICGGFAGIIAGSRSLKSNVVPGVAIATALMPPLCTAGYGLGTLQWDFFLPAMYLFFINSVFIALPTYLYIKYLRFPVKEFLDPLREKKIKRYVTVFLVLVIAPSTIIFYQVLQKSIYENTAENLISQIESDLSGTGTSVINYKIENDPERLVKVVLMGDFVSEAQITSWQNEKQSMDLRCNLKVIQSKDYDNLISTMEERSESANKEYFVRLVEKKDEEIRHMVDSIALLRSRLQVNGLGEKMIVEMDREVKALFPEVKQFGFAQVESNLAENEIAVAPTAFIKWNENILPSEKIALNERISTWLEAKLKSTEVTIKEWE